MEKFNARQKRADRRIENYYEKIRTGKQENPFEEVIVQIGDKDNMGATTKNGQLAKKILDEHMKSFAERNPYLYVYSAHLHMDEATPHLHIDFIPFTTGSTRGLETRVSLKAALQNQGFKGGTRSCTERNEWYESEKVALSKIMLEHGIEWKQKGTHKKHKSRAWDLNLENRQLKVQLRDYNKIKDYLGIDKVKEILKTINASRQKNKQKKRTETER